jgi:cyclopropane-fatty-acyl-phospholipid synthase
LHEYHLANDYVAGDLDIEGNIEALFNLRDRLLEKQALSTRTNFLRGLFFMPPLEANRRAINYHYTLGNDFYLSFIDNAYRLYSHCLFKSDDETLEQAAVHKLESMLSALGMRPGQRL